jgi:hypothetical protein
MLPPGQNVNIQHSGAARFVHPPRKGAPGGGTPLAGLRSMTKVLLVTDALDPARRCAKPCAGPVQ